MITYEGIVQTRIIDNLNKYLEWHNLSVRMNKDGICNGLAAVHTKYVLENKEEAFFKMLQYITEKKPDSEIEMELNHFVVEIILSFLPEIFNQKLTQMNSTEALTINNKILKSAFNFAIITNDKNWADIIKEIDLKNNEVMRITGAAHAVTLSKKDGKFRLFNPNYSSGVKEFTNEYELIQELHKNVFHFQPGNLGMSISVIPHPDSIPRKYPIQIELYDKYLENENITEKPVTSHGTDASPCTLEYAAMFNDGEVIKYLLERGAEDKDHKAAETAVSYNNISALKVLMLNIKDDKTIKKLLVNALKYGLEEVFDELSKNEPYQAVFNRELLLKGALHLAAEGGNPALLEKIINTYKRNPEQTSDGEGLLSQKIVEEFAIMSAINSGSVECVSILTRQLKGDDQLNDNQKLLYLNEAIRKNQPYMVSHFLQSFSSKDSLKNFRMSLHDMEKTDLAILQSLKKEGVSFSLAGNLIMDQKKHKSTALFFSIGIEICKFTEFCKEKLCKADEKNSYINKCKEFGQKLNDITTPEMHHKNSEQHDETQPQDP